MKTITIKMARNKAELLLSKEGGAGIQVGDKYYVVKNATLKDLEERFPEGFRIRCNIGYLEVAED